MNAPRTRAQKKLIKVTFADGTVICYSNATTTFIEALKKIGVDKLKDIDLEIGHLPMISKECHEKFKDYMKPLEGGWYVNTSFLPYMHSLTSPQSNSHSSPGSRWMRR